MVTSQKIDERKMGYRGSKSIKVFIHSALALQKPVIVKEQRVDGS
jgi:hypothetical protein